MADARPDNRTEAEEILADEEAAQAAAAATPLAGADAEDPKKKKNALPEIPVAELAVITCRDDLDRVQF